jgi:hypothetical protein
MVVESTFELEFARIAAIHPRSQGLAADTALPKALEKTKTRTSKIL